MHKRNLQKQQYHNKRNPQASEHVLKQLSSVPDYVQLRSLIAERHLSSSFAFQTNIAILQQHLPIQTRTFGLLSANSITHLVVRCTSIKIKTAQK